MEERIAQRQSDVNVARLANRYNTESAHVRVARRGDVDLSLAVATQSAPAFFNCSIPATMGQHSHKPHLKQSNKPFKSRHSSKGALKDASRGRTSKSANGSTKKPGLNKVNRKHHAKQIQLSKKRDADELGDVFVRKGVSLNSRADRVVTIIPLTSDVDPESIVADLCASAGVSFQADNTGTVYSHVFKFHNQTIRWIVGPCPDQENSLYDIMDLCVCADFTVFGLSNEVEVSFAGENALRALAGMGIGSQAGTTFATMKNNDTPATKSSLQSFMQYFFPPIERVYSQKNHSDASQVIRLLCERVPRGIRWRDDRPRMVAELAHPVTDSLLAVTGTVRGRGKFSANRLVHVVGEGDFQVAAILSDDQATSRGRVTSSQDKNSEPIDTFDPEAGDDLQSTNIPDPEDELMQEQTWPGEENVIDTQWGGDGSMSQTVPAAAPGTIPKSIRKVPKGTSDYQAVWFLDDDDDAGSDASGSADESDDQSMDEDSKSDVSHESQSMESASIRGSSENMSLEASESGSEEGSEFDQDDADRFLSQKKAEREKSAEEDADFPDEVDTPRDIPARERFARFRGLKSFRTSPWDPYEDLPLDFSRLFMFNDFTGFSRAHLARLKEGTVQEGDRVTILINTDKAAHIANHHQSGRSPLIIYGLAKHEHKYSLGHFTVTRNTEVTDVVKNKDPLVVAIGPRRYAVNPIFSQLTHSNKGRGVNNVHKLERFLRHGPHATVASAYIPVTFGKQPAVLLTPDPKHFLVGTGVSLGADPTRITAKRIILSGHPYKVHKRTATIRYMFFNDKDVHYFKPVQLRTKRGRLGYIRESLGTHGYFKAGFDNPIDQMDTVCMSLYKRCYPRWAQPVLRE